MQETPQPSHMTSQYTVASPNVAISTYPVINDATSTGGNSPPLTPAHPPQTPLSSFGTQMQTTIPMHTTPKSQPGYSQSFQTPMTAVVSSDNMSPTSSQQLVSPLDMVPFQETGTSGKSADDIISTIMSDFMEQDCATTSASMNPRMDHKNLGSQYMYNNCAYGQQLGGHMSYPYIPVISPSSASDQPCYSPITPVQSPIQTCESKLSMLSCLKLQCTHCYHIYSLTIFPFPTAPWKYIEQMLTTLLRTEQITRPDFMVSYSYLAVVN